MAKRDDNSLWFASPADPDRPNGPRAWAKLDTSNPIEKMFRKGTLAHDEATAYARYRAAQVWFKFFIRASGLDGYSPMLGEPVDSTTDPGSSAIAQFDAVRERLNCLDVLTTLRFDDLDAVIGYGKTLSERAKENARTAANVRTSLLAALDCVSGYARWDQHLQQVQVLSVYESKDERKKVRKKAA